jgi:VanZ family protein
MQKTKRSTWYYWLPAIAWMVVIFALSSRTRVSVAPEYWTNFMFFKTLHVIEYAVLYALTLRGLAHGSKPTTQHYQKSAIITILYAISDEIHQTFVPTRQGTLRDVLIDSIGVYLSYLIIKQTYNKVKLFFI